MNSIKYVLLKGNENFLDHPKSIALYGKLFWRKSDKKLNVGDIVYLFMSGKGHYQIRYKLEVTNTSVARHLMRNRLTSLTSISNNQVKIGL